MACGALEHSGAQLSASITGIAGPGGAVPGKPVGTVCFGVALKTDGKATVQTSRMQFEGSRDAVRRQSIRYALQLLCKALGDKC